MDPAVAVAPITAAAPRPTPRRWGLLARAVAAVLRCALYVFFRRVEVFGLEKLPSGGPLVLVANHVNGIVDPLLVGLLRQQARFLAKSTLWRHPIIRPLLAITGAIPVFRHQDTGADTERNADSFARCHDALAAGEAIALFPEGKSHSAASLAPLKTGAARIVLEAEAKHPGLAIRIVPIGLSFDAKTLFRSRVVVRVGDAIDPSAEQRLYEVEAWPAVRRLTQRIANGLAAVTVNYASWEEARLLERAADLYAEATADAADDPLAERLALRQRFADGYRDALRRDPEGVRALARKIDHYDGVLRLLNLRDDQVGVAEPLPAVGRALAASAPALLTWLPLAALGTLVNWIPYRLIGALTRRLAPETDVIATYKLLGGVLLFPLWWLLGAAAVGQATGSAWAGAAVLPLAALGGYIAMLFHERRADLASDARAALLLWWRGNLADALARRRADLIAALHTL